MMALLLFPLVYAVGMYLTALVVSVSLDKDSDNELVFLIAALWPLMLVMLAIATVASLAWGLGVVCVDHYPKTTAAIGKTLYIAFLPFRPITLGRLIRSLLEKKGHNK